MSPPSLPPPPTPEPVVRSTRTLALRLGGVFGGGVDGSAWSGFDAEVCVRVGWVCLGGRLQYAIDLGWGGDALSLDGHRSLLDLQLISEWPLAWAWGELSPGAGAGLSILRSGRVYAGQALDDDAGGLRLRAQLALRLSWSSPLALRIVAAADYAPFPHSALNDTQNGDAGPIVSLAGEPTLVAWLKLGLELGGM